MARYLISVPAQFSARVGGDGTSSVQVNVESTSSFEAKKALIAYGIPFAAANSFAAGLTSQFTENSGTKLETIDPATGQSLVAAGGALEEPAVSTAAEATGVTSGDVQGALEQGEADLEEAAALADLTPHEEEGINIEEGVTVIPPLETDPDSGDTGSDDDGEVEPIDDITTTDEMNQEALNILAALNADSDLDPATRAAMMEFLTQITNPVTFSADGVSRLPAFPPNILDTAVTTTMVEVGIDANGDPILAPVQTLNPLVEQIFGLYQQRLGEVQQQQIEWLGNQSAETIAALEQSGALEQIAAQHAASMDVTALRTNSEEAIAAIRAASDAQINADQIARDIQRQASEQGFQEGQLTSAQLHELALQDDAQAGILEQITAQADPFGLGADPVQQRELDRIIAQFSGGLTGERLAQHQLELAGVNTGANRLNAISGLLDPGRLGALSQFGGAAGLDVGGILSNAGLTGGGSGFGFPTGSGGGDQGFGADVVGQLSNPTGGHISRLTQGEKDFFVGQQAAQGTSPGQLQRQIDERTDIGVDTRRKRAAAGVLA